MKKQDLRITLNDNSVITVPNVEDTIYEGEFLVVTFVGSGFKKYPKANIKRVEIIEILPTGRQING